MQNAKIKFPQTFSQESPLETILENTTFSSFGFLFLQKSDFLIFDIIQYSVALPLHSTVIRTRKDSNLNFF